MSSDQKPHELWVILSEFRPGEWNITGVRHPDFGEMTCINSNRHVIEQMFEFVNKSNNARIARFVEVVGES